MYVLTYCSTSLLNVISCALQILDFELEYPSSQSTKSICEEILCLCDYFPPSLVSTLMTYRAPLAGLLTAAAVTFVLWGGAGVIYYI